jgi:hypothetical protein
MNDRTCMFVLGLFCGGCMIGALVLKLMEMLGK